MPRTVRAAPGGYVYHVLNRGVGGMRLFGKPRDYEAFEETLAATLDKVSLRVCGYCLMPNHWHFVVWPEEDDQLALFFQRLTVTHATRWTRAKRRIGCGHVYQGRFKSFPVAADDHFYQVMRYVERNAQRAGLVRRAVDWRWGSLWIRERGTAEQKAWLSAWPVPRPRLWRDHVHAAQTEAELAALRKASSAARHWGAQSGSPRPSNNSACNPPSAHRADHAKRRPASRMFELSSYPSLYLGLRSRRISKVEKEHVASPAQGFIAVPGRSDVRVRIP